MEEAGSEVNYKEKTRGGKKRKYLGKRKEPRGLTRLKMSRRCKAEDKCGESMDPRHAVTQ